MIRATRLSVLLAVTLVGSAHAQSAARAPRPAAGSPAGEPKFIRLFNSDSMLAWSPDLSPDGRWVVFAGSGEGPNASNLWIASTAGGDPIRVTSGHFSDYWPRWFPAGDRIAFLSNRPAPAGTDGSYLMTIPLDPQSGRASGPPRQTTLEKVSNFTVSADGSELGYATATDKDSIHLMVVPAAGGTARLLISSPAGRLNTWCLQWSADGRWLFYGLRPPGTTGPTIMRVPAAGGTPQKVGTTLPTLRAIDPTGRFLLRQMEEAWHVGATMQWEVAAIGGRPISRFPGLPKGPFVWRFTADGRSLIAQQANDLVAIKVVPVEGGVSRQLAEPGPENWTGSWTAGGSSAIIFTQVDGHMVLREIPVNGGPTRDWPLPEGARYPSIARDGRHIWYTLTTQEPGADRLMLAALGETGREVSAHYSVQSLGQVYGPGGVSGDERYFFKPLPHAYELWTAPIEGPPRLLRTFPLSMQGKTGFGVHGSRVAYTERRGDSTALIVARGPSGAPHVVCAVAGHLSDPVWSHDGRWIAAGATAPGDSSHYAVFLVGLDSSARVTSPARTVATTSGEGYDMQWLPDDRGLVVLGEGINGPNIVWLVTTRSGEPAVALMTDSTGMVWDASLSPDGRYVAYPALIIRGSSLWRLDLGALLPKGTAASRR